MRDQIRQNDRSDGEETYLLLFHQSPGGTSSASSSSPAHSMHVFGHVHRSVVRYDVGNRREIHASGNEVRAYQATYRVSLFYEFRPNAHT